MQEEACPVGTPITKGMTVRLQHSSTQTWLHSHRFKSPLSASQEVSAYGSDHVSDSGDRWTVTWAGGDAHWLQGSQVRC